MVSSLQANVQFSSIQKSKNCVIEYSHRNFRVLLESLASDGGKYIVGKCSFNRIQFCDRFEMSPSREPVK